MKIIAFNGSPRKKWNRLRRDAIMCEHGLAPDEDVRRWQDRINSK
jgi:hypothetical protein